MISVTEIILIIIGFVIVVLGYVLPAGRGDGTVNPEEVEELVQDKLDRSLNDSVRRTIDGMAQDAVSDAIDDNKLALSRISNEKVMEISEYAGTVLDDIKKNHDEVVFMYDMLNDKHKNLTSAVSEMTKTAENAKQTVRDAELTARDAKDAAATLDAATARAKAAADEQRARERVTAQTQAAQAAGALKDAVIVPDRQESSEETDPGTAAQPEDDAFHRDLIFPTVSVAAEEKATPLPEQETVINAPAEETIRPVNTPNTAKAAPRRSAPGEPMSQNRQILEMHHAGKSNMVIARELGLGIGEVRLVIDLSKKQTKSGEEK